MDHSALEVALAEVRAGATPSETLRCDEDYIWCVPPEQKYQTERPAGPFTLGQLSESAQWITSALHSDGILTNHLVWIADLLRGIANGVVHEGGRFSLALTREELIEAALEAMRFGSESTNVIEMASTTSWAFSRFDVYAAEATRSDLLCLDLAKGLLVVEGKRGGASKLFWLAELFEAIGHLSLP
ncbi:hypothetical protein [Leifsonia sp. 21MFCrub1.1]|uniref:hypothetical protein n=1 Tax=Leifsonia sp. 21MFCrub1.1 TaxID=1798223 RepID=UPI0012FE6ECF|nr:hypothetical protein [Leifsonia sp. 21MFCrub1.1]